MTKIKSVIAIYNPNSTGNAEADAKEFCKRARAHGLSARAIPTKYTGHAAALARRYASRKKPILVAMASGDGGYNEVVNGILAANNPNAAASVIPSGNANDHYRALHHGNTIKRLLRGDFDYIDVLKLSWGSKNRYAHSYIGFGVTPQIGALLTSKRPGKVYEKWIAFSCLFKRRPVKIRLCGSILRYDHLLFSNIGRMSKVLKVRGAMFNDGQFEIIGVKKGSFGQLFSHFLGAMQQGAKPKARASQVCFKVLSRDIKAQLDGEVVAIKKGSLVTITSKKQALKTIV